MNKNHPWVCVACGRTWSGVGEPPCLCSTGGARTWSLTEQAKNHLRSKQQVKADDAVDAVVERLAREKRLLYQRAGIKTEEDK